MNTVAKGQIVSVNVGAVREIVYRGRPRTTAIWKEPVAGRLPVFAEQVSGDHQADLSVHGGPAKAVYSYASEDYAWWSDELGETLGPGTFGENLTTAGIDLSDLRIGEQVRAGTALLEVTAPRFPCWKLGFRMGTQKFPRRFLEAARAGTYFAVVEQGDVGAGDPIASSCRPPHPVTVGLIAYLNHADRELAALLMEAVQAGLAASEWDALLARVAAP
jgi:MOSC domain-containing protein YiiM